MKRVPLLAALVAGLLATPAAQTTADGEVLVRIETTLGAIDVAVDAKRAIQVIQAGINPARRADGFPPIALERTTVTGLRHTAGTASMARSSAADSARSDFFICVRDEPSLDAGGKRAQDGQGFAAFGRVVQGMHIVRGIQQQPVEKQALTPPIAIIRISRVQ